MFKDMHVLGKMQFLNFLIKFTYEVHNLAGTSLVVQDTKTDKHNNKASFIFHCVAIVLQLGCIQLVPEILTPKNQCDDSFAASKIAQFSILILKKQPVIQE